MAFCKYCGKQVDNGSVCPECAAQHGVTDNAEQLQPVQSAQPAPVQQFNAGAPAMGVPIQPAVKKNVNKGIVALLGLLGVFTVLTTVVVVTFS